MILKLNSNFLGTYAENTDHVSLYKNGRGLKRSFSVFDIKKA